MSLERLSRPLNKLPMVNRPHLIQAHIIPLLPIVSPQSMPTSIRSPRDVWSSFSLVLLCFLFPPLPIFLTQGGIGKDLGINALLTVLGWLPGILHAFTILFTLKNLRIDHKRKRTRVKDVAVPCTGGSKHVEMRVLNRVNKQKVRKLKMVGTDLNAPFPARRPSADAMRRPADTLQLLLDSIRPSLDDQQSSSDRSTAGTVKNRGRSSFRDPGRSSSTTQTRRNRRFESRLSPIESAPESLGRKSSDHSPHQQGPHITVQPPTRSSTQWASSSAGSPTGSVIIRRYAPSTAENSRIDSRANSREQLILPPSRAAPTEQLSVKAGSPERRERSRVHDTSASRSQSIGTLSLSGVPGAFLCTPSHSSLHSVGTSTSGWRRRRFGRSSARGSEAVPEEAYVRHTLTGKRLQELQALEERVRELQELELHVREQQALQRDQLEGSPSSSDSSDSFAGSVAGMF